VRSLANPFALPGPLFLAFYAVLAVIVLVMVYLVRRGGESTETPRVRFEDPYLIAYLRGGKNEALRVATVSLIDRGLLKWEGGAALTATALAAPSRPLEKLLVHYFGVVRVGPAIFGDVGLAAATGDYREMLIRLGLVPSEAEVSARRRRLWFALAILIGVAGTKLLGALSRGRSNVGFLIILAVVACMVAVKIHNPLRTPAGDQLLTDLRNLFARLKSRAHTLRPGGETSEVALLSAVFGVGALSPILFPYAKQLFPRATSSSNSYLYGSSCGSSCGGGGGDGGGGGGCGGCGGGGGD
jgi:uncharacterized protein (TIGR04222 family)